MPIISRTSDGPADTGFNPADLGVTPAPAQTYVYYGVGELPSFDWVGADEVRGVAFVDRSGKRGVVFIGDVHVGETWYDNGNFPPDSPHGKHDPCSQSHGTHAAEGHIAHVWLYDPQDFVAVRQGTETPSSLRAYAETNLTDGAFAATPCDAVGGAAYDTATGRLYVSQLGADSDPNGYVPDPLIHVYQLP